MKGFKFYLGVLLILFFLLACQLGPQPTLTPTLPPTPIHAQAADTRTPLPTATLASEPTLTTEPTPTSQPPNHPTQPSDLPPTPSPNAGPLPAVWTRFDLGLPAGDLYLPYSIAIDAPHDRLYALGQCNMPSVYTYPVETCISVLNLDTDQVQHRAVVPGSAYATLKLIDDTLYIVERWSGNLYALGWSTSAGAETLAVTHTMSDVVDLADDGAGALYALTLSSVERIAPDAQSQSIQGDFSNLPSLLLATPERVFVLGYETLRIFDTELTLLNEIDLRGRSPSRMAFDEDRGRLYIGGNGGLYALDIDTEQLTQLNAELQGIEDILVDAEHGQLLLLARFPADWYGGQQIIAIDPETGAPIRTLFSTLEGYLPALAFDAARGRLLVASTVDHALIPIALEGANGARSADGSAPRIPPGPQRIPLGVEIDEVILDAAANRLYVSDSSGWVRILDRHTYAEIARVYGGRYISLDLTHRRLYAGDPRLPSVQVFGLDDLDSLREIPQSGKPRANPASGDVIVVGRAFHVFDGATGQARPPLVPDVGVPFAECSGCYYTIAREVAIDAVRGLTATITYTPWPGKPGPQESIAVDPLSGRAYYALITGGYIHQSSIDIYPDLGALQTRLRPTPGQPSSPPLRTLEGLSGYLMLDVSVRHLYVMQQNILFILDSETLDRLGRVELEHESATLLAVDGELGRLYSADEGTLAVWVRTGGTAPTPLPPEPVVLTSIVESILPSPNFAEDQTLLALVDQKLCRSTDGGKTWHRPRGGLPSAFYYSLRFTAAFSPGYANDNTLWAGALAGDSHGEGVWTSTDGGGTWHLSSDGLLDLRVYRLAPSPNFERDHTLLAYAYGRNGSVLYRSTNAGASWQLVLRQSGYEQPPLPRPETMFYVEQPEPQFKCDYEGVCQRADDGGKTWQPFDTGGAPLDPLVGYVISPFFEADRAIYFMSQSGLYRASLLPPDTTLWERCVDRLCQDRDDYTRYLTALAIAQTGESTYALFIGTAAGEFYRLSPDDLDWERIETGAQVTPTPPPVPTPAATHEPPTPTPCASAIDERLQTNYANLPPKLGCAVKAGISTAVAYQPFELGRMLWRADLRQIYVLAYDGTWRAYEDTWDESQPDRDPDIAPPEYFIQPMRGFGKVWREQLSGVESWIGWAIDQESGYDTAIQAFSYGLLLWAGEEHMLYVLYNDGTWDTAYEQP